MMRMIYILFGIVFFLSVSVDQAQEFRGRVIAIDWHPDDNQLVVMSLYRCGDPTVESPSRLDIVNVTKGLINHTLERSGCVADSVVFSPDGSRIAYAADGAAFITDSTLQPQSPPISQAFNSKVVKWDKDGSRLVTTVMGFIEVVDPQTGEQLYAMQGNAGSIADIDWSADYTRLVSDDIEGNIRIWDADTGAILSVFSNSETVGGVTSLDWHPESSILAATHLGGDMVLWDTDTQNPLTTLSGQSFFDVQWNPDGRLLAVASRNQILIWDATTESVVSTLNSAFTIRAMAWKPDGSMLAYGGDNPEIVINEVSLIATPTPTPLPPLSELTMIARIGGNDNDQQTEFGYQMTNTGDSPQGDLSTRVFFSLDAERSYTDYTLDMFYDSSNAASVSGPVQWDATTAYFIVDYGTSTLAVTLAGGQTG